MITLTAQREYPKGAPYPPCSWTSSCTNSTKKDIPSLARRKALGMPGMLMTFFYKKGKWLIGLLSKRTKWTAADLPWKSWIWLSFIVWLSYMYRLLFMLPLFFWSRFFLNLLFWSKSRGSLAIASCMCQAFGFASPPTHFYSHWHRLADRTFILSTISI